MPKPVDPYTESPASELDVVEAYRIHSQQGIEALMAILQGLLRSAQGNRRREIVARLLDRFERLDEDYRKIANELAPETEVPDRAQRWPGLFRLDEGATDA